MIKKLFKPLLLVLTLLIISTLIPGCAEQPVGYNYQARQRDHSILARTTLEVVNAVYQATDETVDYLVKASLTDDYGSILPDGWIKKTRIDPDTEIPFDVYILNYLDQDYSTMAFDLIADENAIRTPSSIAYEKFELKSYQNGITNKFFWDISRELRQRVEYSNNRRDHLNVDGWSYIGKLIQVEEEFEVAGGQTVTYTISLLVRWNIKVEKFSIDPKDQSSRLLFTGIMPVRAEDGEFLRNQISGEINIDKDGKGSGEMSYYGEPSIKLYFTGRSYSFQGYYTIADEDHNKQYQLQTQ